LFFSGQFISEYVGEVLDAKLFKKRQKEYQQENIQHHYFMALNNEEVIDATRKGNCTRFTNHSCDPNSETQKVRDFFLFGPRFSPDGFSPCSGRWPDNCESGFSLCDQLRLGRKSLSTINLSGTARRLSDATVDHLYVVASSAQYPVMIAKNQQRAILATEKY
jgi:hypothetical protein